MASVEHGELRVDERVRGRGSERRIDFSKGYFHHSAGGAFELYLAHHGLQEHILESFLSLSLSTLSSLLSLSLSLSLFLSFSTHTHTHTHSGLDGDYSGYDNGHYITVARTVGGSYLGAGLGAAQAHILKSNDLFCDKRCLYSD